MANSANPFDYYTNSSTANGALKATSPLAGIIGGLQLLVVVAGFLVVIYLFFIIPTQVSGQSMERNFFDGQVLFTNKLIALTGGNYSRGDVVVFGREGKPDLIKRVIALPGERVKIQNNRVFVNGVLLAESYISDDKPTAAGSFMQEGVERVVPEGSYFCLGDNRTNSLDSRDASVGFVKREQLKGGSFLRVFPFSSFGGIVRPNYNI
jgi:signal peptidase I